MEHTTTLGAARGSSPQKLLISKQGLALSGQFPNVLPTQKVIAKVPKTLREYASTELVSDLQTLVANEAALADIATDSYIHGNGFYKLVLAKFSGCKLRLHVWMPGVNAEENVHEHRWAFASTVIHGALESELFQEDVSTAARAYDEYLYRAANGESPASQSYVGETKLIRTKSTVRRAGEAYWMSPNTLHRIVRTDDSLTATLMIQSPPARKTNRLLTTPGQPADVAQRYLTGAEVYAVIDTLLSHIKPSGYLN